MVGEDYGEDSPIQNGRLVKSVFQVQDNPTTISGGSQGGRADTAGETGSSEEARDTQGRISCVSPWGRFDILVRGVVWTLAGWRGLGCCYHRT